MSTVRVRPGTLHKLLLVNDLQEFLIGQNLTYSAPKYLKNRLKSIDCLPIVYRKIPIHEDFVERPILQQAIEFCKTNHISILLVCELSRLGRNVFEVLATVKDLIDSGINLYMQKEQLTLLDAEGKPTMFAPIMIATLSTCAQLERENINFRLNSGRKLYIERGGKLDRKVGSVKSTEQKRDEHKDIISYLKRGYSVRNTAKLTSKGISTVQRIKTEFAL